MSEPRRWEKERGRAKARQRRMAAKAGNRPALARQSDWKRMVAKQRVDE